MKRFFQPILLLLALLLPAIATAHDFVVDGIYYNFLNDNEVTVTSGEYGREVVIPETVTYEDMTYTVTAIDSTAFKDCSTLNYISISKTIKTIGKYAFQGCYQIYYVNITDVEAWCNLTFEGDYSTPCHNINYFCLNGQELTNLVIPNTVTKLGDYAFYGCTSITNVIVPNSVTEIGRYAFANCSRLTSIVFPNSITEMKEGIFINCTALVDVNIPNQLTAIPDHMFAACFSIPSIEIPNTVTHIGYRSFDGCHSLNNVFIPSSVVEIDDLPFTTCRSLTKLTVASDNPKYDSRDNCNAIIETATNTLIVGCPNTIVPNTVTKIGRYAFFSCDNLTDVILPPSVTSISNQAYSYCHKLTVVNIPTTVKELWGGAFWECNNLTTVFIPESITLLGSQAFSYCKSLKDVYTYIPDPSLLSTMGSLVFNAHGDYSGRTLHVPKGSLEMYQSDPKWNAFFANIVEMGNVLEMPNSTVMHGDVVAIPVSMSNEDEVVAFQTDIILPEGFTVVTDEDDEYVITPTDRLGSDHMIMAQTMSNGAVRVMCYTPSSEPIEGNEGELFTIYVRAPQDACGNYTIKLNNSRVTMTDLFELRLINAEANITVNIHMPGDANDSHTVTVTDIVTAAQYVVEMHPDPFDFESADMNGDGLITVTDIMMIVHLILYPPTNAPSNAPAITTNLDCMTGEDITIKAGEARRMSIMLDNDTDYSAFQLDLQLPVGLTASNFALTDRGGNHLLEVNTLDNGKLRALCYSPAIVAFDGHSGALLTFDVTATDNVTGMITVDGIELVTTSCQTQLLDGFAFGVNMPTAVSELINGKTIVSTRYYNLAGQEITEPASGVNIVVTTLSDGTSTTSKVIMK